MKTNRLATMAAMGLLAGAFILHSASARAQTVPVTYTYAFFGSGPHHRQPRTVSGSGFTTLSSQPGGQWTTGQQQAPVFLPPTLTVGPQSYQFAFATGRWRDCAVWRLPCRDPSRIDNHVVLHEAHEPGSQLLVEVLVTHRTEQRQINIIRDRRLTPELIFPRPSLET